MFEQTFRNIDDVLCKEAGCATEQDDTEQTPLPASAMTSAMDACLDFAAEQLGQPVHIDTELSGGDVAEAYRLRGADGQLVFMKTHRNPPPHFFQTEATGLVWLRETRTVSIPEVLGVSDSPPVLLLEWIKTGPSNPGTESSLGTALADLHRIEQPGFGRSDVRTTGSLAVPNAACDSWNEFIATQRFMPLARIARDRGSLPDNGVKALERLAGKIDRLDVPDEHPALLHGDLWAGNRLVDNSGQSWLIDPAAHCGHREYDLAMMRLFGGYGAACFAAYEESYPLQPGWEDRITLHQIAPLTVHAIKFGGSYVGATLEALARFA